MKKPKHFVIFRRLDLELINEHQCLRAYFGIHWDIEVWIKKERGENCTVCQLSLSEGRLVLDLGFLSSGM